MGIIYRNGIQYSGGGGGTGKAVSLTQAEYDALVAANQDDPDTPYFIIDGVSEGGSSGAGDAISTAFDDTETQLGVDNVQDAIVAVFQSASEYKQKIVDALTGIGITDVSTDMSVDELSNNLSKYAVMKSAETYTIFTYGSAVPYPDLTGSFNGSWSHGTASTAGGASTATGVTEKAVDLTNVKTLTANISWRTTGSRTVYATFGVQEVAGTYTKSNQKSATSSGDQNSTGVITIDVSDLTGSYYLGCTLQNHTYCMARISSIVMAMK